MSIKSFFKKLKSPITLAVGLSILVSSIGLSIAVLPSTGNTLYLTEENSISLFGEVNDDSVRQVIQELKEHEKDKEVFLFIQSPGGSVTAGNRLIEVMKNQKNITCVVNFAASMAFSILQQGCTKRLVTENAVLMQHHVAIGGYFTIKDLREILPILQSLEDGLNRGDAERMGLTIDEFRKKLGNEWWIKGADAALKENAADGKVTVFIQMNLSRKVLERLPNSN